MEGRTVGIIVVVLIVLVGGWFLFKGVPASAPAAGGEVSNQMPVIGSSTPEMIVEDQNMTVTYTDQGFSPASVTVPLGATITFVNQSSKSMWVASAMHPAHTAYSGTSLSQHCPDTSGTAFDECAAGAPGTSYSFTFAKMGTWRYHDHLDASKFGSVVVTPEP